MEKLLELLEQDCTMPVEALAAAAGVSVDEAKAAIKKYEDDRTILGYQAIVDWDRVHKENVTALTAGYALLTRSKRSTPVFRLLVLRRLSAANDPQDRPVEDEKVYLLRLLHQ